MDLINKDKKFVWHPFTQQQIDTEMAVVTKGQGAWLTLADGTQILDAVSSWFVNIHGHANPHMAKAIYEQALQLEHAIFARYTHQPAIELAELLINAAQSRQLNVTRCFYSDNGATAVEVALKMAFQYHLNRGDNKRTRFLALENSYHGDTLGAMSVGDRDSFAKTFSPLLMNVDFIPVEDLERLTYLLEQHGDEYAALILEPMIQAVGGMKMHSATWLQAIEKLCRRYGILLIADEVFTGFYRTGTLFACEHTTIKPDLICLAKGLTGGYLPLSATLTTEAVYQAFLGDSVAQAFLHGHSFTGSPLACAAALASWQLLMQESTQQAIQRINAETADWIAKLAKHPRVKVARHLGTVGAIEIKDCPDYFSGFSRKLSQLAKEQGVLFRPFGDTLYAVPPYCVTTAEIAKIYQTMELILDNFERIL